MKTITEVSRLTGASVRALRHYDKIGLLKPGQVTEAGYRLYDDAEIERLYLILLYREIGFSLKDIREILDAPDFDRNRVLDQQIALLQKKTEHLKNQVTLARGIKLIGVRYLEFEGFKPDQLDDYAAQAKTLYGKTDAYREFVRKSEGRTKEQSEALGNQVMDFFVRLGTMRDLDPGSEAVQRWVKELQDFFTEHYYTCTNQILRSLGEGYAGGGTMNENIDKAGGKGTGEFARQAIEIYTR